MNEASCVVYVAVFLALPPALLTARSLDKRRMPWALLLGVSVIGGWLLVNLAYRFYVNGRAVRMSVNGVHRAMASPARDDFLLQFGWLIGFGYLLPWLFLYCVFVFVRWMLASRA
jgi:hypothetical protein